MASELVRLLVDSGIHFGHRVSRWNPKMAPYIFGKRNTIHILDIRETIKGLLRAKKLVTRVVASGADVLFVGTKRQARSLVRQQAQRTGMPYVCERWLGGTLTNFKTIRSRLSRLDELEAAEADGTALEYSKKMISTRARELRKIRRNLEGIRRMDKLPGALLVIDVRRERNAVREAKNLGISTVCLIDTDSDPDFADVPIPGNDDAIRAIDAILTHLGDAIEEGKKGRVLAASAPPSRQSGSVEQNVGGATAEGEAREAGGGEGDSSAVPASTSPAVADRSDSSNAGVTAGTTGNSEVSS